MKSQFKTLIGLMLCALEIGCSNSSGASAGARAAAASGTATPPSSTVVSVTQDDFRQLEALAATDGLTVKAKAKLVSAFINELAKKYRVGRDIVAQQISANYGLAGNFIQPEDYDPKKIIALNLAVGEIRKAIATANGVGFGHESDDFYFAANNKQVKNMRTNGVQQALLDLDRLHKEKMFQSQVVFSTIDVQAQTDADILVASLSSASPVSSKSLEKAQELASDNEKAQALAFAPKVAEMMRAKTGATDDQLVAVLPYLANSILKYGLSTTLGRGKPSTFDFSQPSTARAASELIALGQGIGEIASLRSKNVTALAEAVKSMGSVGPFVAAPTQDSANAVDADLKTIVNDGHKVIEIGKKLPIDQRVVDAASTALDVADMGEKALAAFVSPTPSNIISAVSSLFGSAKSASPEAAVMGKLSKMDAKLDKMNEKLDIVTNLQQATLKELEKTDGDVVAVKNAVLNNGIKIDALSKQIADSSQKIYDKLTSLGDGEQRLAVLAQQTELIQTGADACGRLTTASSKLSSTSSNSKSLRWELFTADQATSLESCTSFVSQLDPEGNVGKMFVETDGVGGDNLDNKTYLALLKLSDPARGLLPGMLVNPVVSTIDLTKIATLSTDLLVPAGSQDVIGVLARNFTSPTSALLDAGLVAKYADIVMQISSDASLYQSYKEARDDEDESALSVLADMSNAETNYAGYLTKLMSLVNVSIAQQAMLSGLTLMDTQLATVFNAVPGNCANDFDFVCVLSKNSEIRQNFVMKGLSDSIYGAGSNSDGYDFAMVGLAKVNTPSVNPEPLNQLLGSPWKIQVTPLKAAKIECQAMANEPWPSVSVGGVDEALPCWTEQAHGVLQYSQAMYTLLAVRENLLDLMTEMRFGDLRKDHPEQWNQVFRKILQQAL